MPSQRLLLQHAPLDAIAAGLGTSLRAAGVSLADLLPRVQPSLKVIMVVCDPVSRLRALSGSHAGRVRRLRREFDRCILRATAATTCAARLSASDGALVEGAYSLWVRELMRALPASQLRVLRGEDLRRNPTAAASEALEFLGLPAHPAVDRAAAAAAAAEPVSSRLGSAVGDSRSPVADFYKAFDAELAHLMDGDARFVSH